MARTPDTFSDAMPLRVRDSLEAVLDYLWHDEERHFDTCDTPNSGHIFEHLQTIRAWLKSMKSQPK